jgi:Flp pilus assembly protein TadD
MRGLLVLILVLLVMGVLISGCATPSTSSNTSSILTPSTTLKSPTSSIDATKLYNNAHTLNNQGHYEEALPLLETVLQKDPNNADAWGGKSYALQKMGRYEEALVACDKELELKPNDIMVLTNKGQILNALGRRDEAEAIYNKAVHLGYKNNTKAEEQLAQLSV